MWFIPISGQGIISTGAIIIIFSDNPITHNVSNGIHDLNTRFRTSHLLKTNRNLDLKFGLN